MNNDYTGTVKARSEMELAWKQLKKNRLAMFGGIVLIILYTMMFLS